MKRLNKTRMVLILILCLTAALIPLTAVPAAAENGTVSGTFPLVEGMDVATVRYLYEEDGEQTYAFADFEQTEDGYAYSFTAPAEDFTAVEASSLGDVTGATVIAEYFSVGKWDGAVDVSWYNETDSVFRICTPAQLAGLAAVVNGVVDGSTPEWRIKGDRSFISSTYSEEGELPAGGTGPLHTGLPEHDFSGRTVVLMNDLDMGGVPGSEIEHYGYNDVSSRYDYPNWMPIGGQYLADTGNFDSMVMAFFNGTFDGNGHRIENIYCYRRTEGTDPEGKNNAFCYGQGTGLFGAVGTLYKGEETPAADPAIRNVSVSGYVYGRRMVGGLVGYAGGGSNSVDYSKVNGVNIENCVNRAYVYNTDSKGVAGIIATAMIKGNIINCYNTGNISTNYANPCGGIVGSNEGMNVYCCYNAGKLDTHGNSRGRGIGCNADAGAGYTVNNCYYLHGTNDDQAYPGYYTANLAPSISVTVAEVTEAQMTDGTLLGLLNVNGTAFVEGADGRPALFWERNAIAESNVTLEQRTGGTITASLTGAAKTGTVVYMTNETETGWSFRYYTLNGRELTGAYATINGDSVLSGLFEAVVAGVLNIDHSEYCDISVTKNGVVEAADGTMENVTNRPVASGDPLYENDVLKVTAVLHDGALPENEDMIFSAAAGLNNPYTYTYTYVGTESEPETRVANTYTVDERISGEGVTLLLQVTPLETQKLWRYSTDTSWYDAAGSEFTVTTARQLAGIQTLVLQGESFAGKTVRLGADISMANDDGTSGRRFWDGIGNANNAFSGTFDGQGHSITDLHGNQFGLFAYVKGTESRPAAIRDVSVYGDMTGAAACGIAAYGEYVQIGGCSSYSIITGTASCSAGILGTDQGGCTVTACRVYGSVSGVGSVGGIAGVLSSTGTVTECINKGNVSCPKTGNYHTGGVVGNLSGTVERSANTGKVTSAGRNTGGVAGQSVNKNASLTDCYNAGSVTHDGGTSTLDSVGGLIGFASYYRAENCHNYGAVSKVSGSLDTNIGGVFGRDGKKSESVTLNVRYNADGNEYAAMSTVPEDLGTVTYWAGIAPATEAEFADPEGVLAAINGNAGFLLLNGQWPELAYESGTVHVHSGGTATCTKQAVCEVCGLAYGETDPDHHGATERLSRREPAWTVDGSTGDLVCTDCGAVVEAGDPIPADTAAHAFTVTVVCDGETVSTKEYTIAEFDALKTTGAIGYMFGKSVMVTDWYVTLESIFEDTGVPESRLVRAVVRGNGIQGTLTKEKYETENKYYDENDTEYPAPAAIAIRWGSGAGTFESLLDNAVLGDLRFGYGVSEETKESSAGNRLISPVDRMEIVIEPESSGAAVSGAVTGYAGEGTVSVTLAQNGGTAAAAEVTGNGSYLFEAVADGDYTLTVSADGDYVSHEYALTVSGTDVTLDVTIFQLGDVNMDGTRSASDVTAIGRHLAKLGIITDEYALLLADADRSGGLTAADATRLGRYVAKLISQL